VSGSTDRLARRHLGVRLGATLAAAGVVSVAFTLGALLLVAFVQRSQVASIDSSALARARDVAAVAATGPLQSTVASTGEESSLVQVVGPAGTVLASSGNIEGEPAALPSPPQRRATTFQTRTGLPISQGEPFRVVAVPVSLKAGKGWVYVATSLAQVNANFSRLVQALLIGLPVLLLVVVGVIWLTVGRALRPVERIRRRAAEIGGQDLQRRVPVPASRDEVARLAETMNEMLSRLQAAAGRQQRFIGDASHELKSPLSALRAQVDVALTYPEDGDTHDVLVHVQEQTKRMAGIVDDLLFLARAAEHTLTSGSECVDLDELVMAEVHRLRALGSDVEIRLVGPDAARVVGSPGDLTRMVRNLGDNAIAHASTCVHIGLRQHNDEAVITVVDDGPGIPVDLRSVVFERFTRLEVDRSRHDGGGGTGLGLAISREIARAHGGELRVGDRADGRPGAAFTVRIPVKD
jgi:signal transduction histidine kinase